VNSGIRLFKKIRLVRPLVALMILSLSVLIAPSAQAATAPSQYTPTTGMFFNNPTGVRGENCLTGCRQSGWQPTDYQQLTLMNQIMNAVNSVPEGSIIRFVAYSFDYQPMADALIAAKKRGVQVRLLIDSHTNTGALDSLRKGLGTSKSKSSYITTCKYSCMSSKPSFIHSKLYLFSRAGGARYVAMNSSANPAETGISKSWNNTYTTVGDKTLYDAYVDNFNDMLPDKTNTDYYHTVQSGPYPTKEYFFPRAGSTKNSDTLYNILNDVSCPKSGPKTEVRLTTYFWTSARLYLAEKLTALQNAGCIVEVIYPDGSGNQDTIYPQVTAELLHGNVPTYNTRPVGGLYIHNKEILIKGVYQGLANQKIVYATSQNLTMTSLRESNEVMLRIPNVAVYDAYYSNFADIRDHHAQRVTSTSAKTTAGVQSANETASGKAPKDNSPDPDE
jgi:PLD-like domain